jgi:hypothetical protein
VDRERDGGKIFLYLSLQKIRSHLVSHGAEPAIHFREEYGLRNAGEGVNARMV